MISHACFCLVYINTINLLLLIFHPIIDFSLHFCATGIRIMISLSWKKEPPCFYMLFHMLFLSFTLSSDIFYSLPLSFLISAKDLQISTTSLSLKVFTHLKLLMHSKNNSGQAKFVGTIVELSVLSLLVCLLNTVFLLFSSFFTYFQLHFTSYATLNGYEPVLIYFETKYIGLYL